MITEQRQVLQGLPEKRPDLGVRADVRSHSQIRVPTTEIPKEPKDNLLLHLSFYIYTHSKKNPCYNRLYNLDNKSRNDEKVWLTMTQLPFHIGKRFDISCKSLSLIVSFLLLMSTVSCNLPLSSNRLPSTPPPPTKPEPPISTSTPKQPPPEHRIGIRVVNGAGEFYDQVTGEKFVPRGANYVALGMQKNRAGEEVLAHATFAPGFYDHTAAEQTLQKMHADGYNVVRSFLETTTTTSISGASYGLSSAYMDNVTDFLKVASANEMYVIFATDWIADSLPYRDIVAKECCDTFNSSNAVHLSASGVEASRAFYRDFISNLIGRNAPLEAVFSFNVSNELAFDSNEPPLSWDSGSVTLGNGQTYDMSNPDDKKRIIDDGLVYYIDQVRMGILEVDPTAIVGVGFFAPQGPNPHRIGDTRVIRTYAAIWESDADYIDLHAYPFPGDLSLAQFVENYEINGMQEKPIIMGEFGAFQAAYPNSQTAAQVLQAWQIESCQYGFDGWLLWTWDNEFLGEMYSALSDGGAINGVLAPVIRPDPCQ